MTPRSESIDPRIVHVEAVVTVLVAPDAPADVISRVTGPGGDFWRASAYDLHTEPEVYAHWAHNAVVNGTVDACQLDGWADLPPETVTFSVEVAYVDA
jgi:hypothetical protein